MTSVAFDTLKFANRLKTAGVPAAHAEAEAEALAEVLEINLQGLAESESKNGKALARLEANTKEGFAQVDQRFEKIDQRFEKIDQRFEKIDQRFAQVDQRFEQIAKDFAQLDKNMDQRFAQVDQRFVEIKGEMLLLKWMFGVIVTSLIALIIKAFF
ncbi:hypothetical protein [Xylella fastidiosa]|uniref:hypothetical protein n=1 Tax=Xylella fastidiosa TaxID=2371 RepID=UPI000765B74D|nr:hypothetical protein [Xylella fastidiosa]KXB13642.1 hypothetical protein ADT33_08105 [Xylella fastidiosa]